MTSVKKRIFQILEPAKKGDKLSNLYDILINMLIVASVLMLYIETFDQIIQNRETFFRYFYVISTNIFAIEYLLKLWTADLKYPKQKGKNPYMVYLKSRSAIIDFLATFPAYFPLKNSKIFLFLRIFRLSRLFRSPQFARLNEAVDLFSRVINRKKSELTMTFSLVIILILITSLLMFYAENEAQPDVFRSVGDSIWWAGITLTTVGYGDLYPITAIGRFLGIFIALLGIGIIALPTGILSGALMEELEEKKSRSVLKCPHCGKKISA